MSTILVKDIINISNPEDFKLHVARKNEFNQRPLDTYTQEGREAWKEWNTWDRRKDIWKRDYIFALIDFYHETNQWLFGGIFKVLSRVRRDDGMHYGVDELSKYSPYVGRLKIEVSIKERIRHRCLEQFIEKMTVTEILREPYSGEEFPGYGNINHDFRTLAHVFKIEHKGWRTALENVKGIYVVIDASNGKKYIGAAYGNSGIWSRWSSYIHTGHGELSNELVSLIKRKGIDYAKNNFRMSLLETFPMKTDDNLIRDKETYWKEVFLSRGEFGYNKN